MRVVTLIENHKPEGSSLICEHGLSLWIEAGGKKLLFDTGATGRFVENAKNLGVSLCPDAVILSHGHDDHSGGFLSLAENMGSGRQLYVGDGFFEPKYKKISGYEYQYGGNGFSKDDLPGLDFRLTEVEENVLDLGEGLCLMRGFPPEDPYEKIPERFVLKREDEYLPDAFTDELVLTAETDRGVVIVTGCAHCGIINIVEAVKDRIHLPVRGIIGGLHLKGTGAERIEHTARYLKGLDLEFLACAHCTGNAAMSEFDRVLGDLLIENVTGSEHFFLT